MGNAWGQRLGAKHPKLERYCHWPRARCNARDGRKEQENEREIQVDTVSLDYFVKAANIDRIDFIKIDVQGAELEIFRGGERSLKDVVAIVTEVEFEPIYVGQTIYEDVSIYLREQGFAFHKFLGLAGRAV